MFVVLSHYTTSLEEVEKHIPEHLAYVDTQYQKGYFVVSGRRKPREGAVFLARGLTRHQLGNILMLDPLSVNGCVRFEILEFEPMRWQAAFAPLLDPAPESK